MLAAFFLSSEITASGSSFFSPFWKIFRRISNSSRRCLSSQRVVSSVQSSPLPSGCVVFQTSFLLTGAPDLFCNCRSCSTLFFNSRLFLSALALFFFSSVGQAFPTYNGFADRSRGCLWAGASIFCYTSVFAPLPLSLSSLCFF